ncbi:MAG TPA: kinase [Deltaproteobacteria bacterium]|nr:kinase [Deltaproteobacteria bacterium]
MTLPPLIEALLDPASYADPPERVELVQTHISYIFLTPRLVYKVKKPLDLGFLDFSTLEKRLRCCTEEVRLNRRFSKGVYLGVAAVTARDGSFVMEGEGSAVEYAVKMRRLPAESMLSALIERGEAGAATVERIARAVASFHAATRTDRRIARYGRPEAVRANTDENFAQTRRFRGRTVTAESYEEIRAYTDRFLAEKRGLLEGRVAGGHIRDCHGDLHSEHISVTDGINIIDCIEFNERFRYGDRAADIAFLSMDLDCRGRGDLSQRLDRAYFEAADDEDGPLLMDFYRCYRAYVRGKVESFRYEEPEVPASERRLAALSAARHFHLARLYATGGFRPDLLVVCGLTGTGKSTLAAALSGLTAMPVLSSDIVRKELTGTPRRTRRLDPYGKGIYAPEITARTYDELVARAERLLAERRPVIVDATFTKKEFMERAAAAAARRGARFLVVRCTAPEEEIKRRLERRFGAGETAPAVSDGRWEIYVRQKAAADGFEAHLTVDTSAPLERSCDRVLSLLYSIPPEALSL